MNLRTALEEQARLIAGKDGELDKLHDELAVNDEYTMVNLHADFSKNAFQSILGSLNVETENK